MSVSEWQAVMSYLKTMYQHFIKGTNHISTLYVPCIMFQCVDKTKRCNTFYEWSLLFIIWLYMFRTITSPSSGASSHKLYNALVRSCYQLLLRNN